MKRYYITLLTNSGELDKSFQTDSVKTALNKWFQYTLKRPTMANISCGSKGDALALYKVFLDNRREYYNRYWIENSCAYKFEYIKNSCLEKIRSNSFHFMGNSEFYDSVFPFCYG